MSDISYSVYISGSYNHTNIVTNSASGSIVDGDGASSLAAAAAAQTDATADGVAAAAAQTTADLGVKNATAANAELPQSQHRRSRQPL